MWFIVPAVSTIRSLWCYHVQIPTVCNNVIWYLHVRAWLLQQESHTKQFISSPCHIRSRYNFVFIAYFIVPWFAKLLQINWENLNNKWWRFVVGRRETKAFQVSQLVKVCWGEWTFNCERHRIHSNTHKFNLSWQVMFRRICIRRQSIEVQFLHYYAGKTLKICSSVFKTMVLVLKYLLKQP